MSSVDPDNNDGAAAAAAAAARAAVNNPYAMKKTGPALSMKPLHKQDSTSSTDDLPNTMMPLLQQPTTTSIADQTDASETNDLITADRDAPTTIANDTTLVAAKAAPQEKTLAAVGINLPMWQRLPSRNLSFGSAEILTVSECYQHAALYVGKSVRITGTILYSHVHVENGLMSLVFGDPIMRQLNPQSIAARRRSSLGLPSSRRVSLPKTPGTVLRTVVRKRTPGTGLRRASGSLQAAQQQHQSVSLSACPAATPAQKRTLSTTSSRKRPLSPSPPQNPLVQALQGANCVWVLADPTHVSVQNCLMGDLVMALGELVDATGNSALPAAIQTIAAALQPQSSATEPTSPQPKRPVYLLQARILRNVAGTNMKLHVEALRARRKQLLTTKDAESLDPLQGCGPPPYTKATD